ncbi:Angiotensin-converting enzyme [Blattella germanica]|nr:Angiotensin-converting enzyme [Blattella germanica]
MGGGVVGKNQQTLAFAQFEKEQWEEHFRGVDWQSFQNETVKRQLRALSILGVSALNDTTLSELNAHQTNMTTIYSAAKICPYNKENCDLATEGLALDPGFKDNGEMWRNEFESDNFVEDMMRLWQQVEPLYLELHTYVKEKLKTVYGELLGDDDLIPAHILDTFFEGYDPKKMFVTSDEFYQSLGLPENSMSYNESVAMIEKPEDGRVVVCHASAWDFCDRKDFRIKMCTKINTEDFITIHHEMGHIQYYIQYKNQPYALRVGANPGFHEAVGDTIALSVSTPQHLEKIGLLTNYEDSYNSSINALMLMALQKVAFLPFGLLIDMWRWDVFSGTVPETQWNAHWWELSDGLKLGGSRHWSETLYLMTGEREMSGEPLLEYFQPLYEYLKAENSKQARGVEGASSVSEDSSIPIAVGAVLLGVVAVVVIGYVVFRRRAMRRSNA